MTQAPAFETQGQGDTAVLLLHGVGGGRAIWGDAASGTARAVAQACYRAVAVDLPGYGDSASMGAPDLAALVAGVRAVIGRLGASRVVLLGHSMGGMVAQELMAQSPLGVDGLILACTSASFGHGRHAQAGVQRRQALGQELRLPVAVGLAETGAGAGQDQSVRTQRRLRSAVRTSRQRQGGSGLVAWVDRTEIPPCWNRVIPSILRIIIRVTLCCVLMT